MICVGPVVAPVSLPCGDAYCGACLAELRTKVGGAGVSNWLYSLVWTCRKLGPTGALHSMRDFLYKRKHAHMRHVQCAQGSRHLTAVHDSRVAGGWCWRVG